MPSMRAKVRLREGPSGEVPMVQSQREADISNWEIAPSVSSLRMIFRPINWKGW